MSQQSSPSGRLKANESTKVYWAWGMFVGRYLLYTTAPMMEVRWYGTITVGIPIPRGPFQSGEEFSVPVIGYSDLWFRAGVDCTYRMIPQEYKPLPFVEKQF